MKLVLNQERELFRVLSLTGSDYDQGFQHGQRARDLIQKNIAETDRWVRQTYHSGAKRLERHYQNNLAFLEKSRPELLEELRGIADGSGFSFQEIIRLNLQIYFTLKWLAPECSQFCKVVQDRNGQSTTFAGKTRDNSAGPRESVVLMRTYDSGLKMIEVGFAGIVTGPGNVLTNRRISVTSSGVWSPRLPVDPADFLTGEVLPDTHRLARTISSLDEAAQYLQTLPRASGMNYIVSVPKEMRLFSLNAREVMSRTMAGAVCATNHYPFERWEELSYLEYEYPSTHYRFRRITQLLPSARTVKDFWEILSDHRDFPQNSVCRHPLKGAGSWTTYGALSVVEEETMYVVFGNPCLMNPLKIRDGLKIEL